MTRSLLLMSASAFLAMGCFGPSANEDNYFEKLETAACKYAKDCAAYSFYYAYDDVSDCVSELEDQRDDNEDQYDFLQDECDFDEDKAKECLSAYSSSCKDSADDDFFEPCDEVWDCDDADVTDDDGGDDGGGEEGGEDGGEEG